MNCQRAAANKQLRILAISGSTRADSCNTALLQTLNAHAPANIEVSVFTDIQNLPIFSPDLEGKCTPTSVTAFCKQIRAADGLIISSPEYVRAIPGGLKNAIDWLVSRDEITHKPIALAHTSHRGDDMLTSLRLVLSTISERFAPDIFLRFALLGKSQEEINTVLNCERSMVEKHHYLQAFGSYICESALTKATN